MALENGRLGAMAFRASDWWYITIIFPWEVKWNREMGDSFWSVVVSFALEVFSHIKIPFYKIGPPQYYADQANSLLQMSMSLTNLAFPLRKSMSCTAILSSRYLWMTWRSACTIPFHQFIFHVMWRYSKWRACNCEESKSKYAFAPNQLWLNWGQIVEG